MGKFLNNDFGSLLKPFFKNYNFHIAESPLISKIIWEFQFQTPFFNKPILVSQLIYKCTLISINYININSKNGHG